MASALEAAATPARPINKAMADFDRMVKTPNNVYSFDFADYVDVDWFLRKAASSESLQNLFVVTSINNSPFERSNQNVIQDALIVQSNPELMISVNNLLLIRNIPYFDNAKFFPIKFPDFVGLVLQKDLLQSASNKRVFACESYFFHITENSPVPIYLLSNKQDIDPWLHFYNILSEQAPTVVLDTTLSFLAFYYLNYKPYMFNAAALPETNALSFATNLSNMIIKGDNDEYKRAKTIFSQYLLIQDMLLYQNDSSEMRSQRDGMLQSKISFQSRLFKDVLGRLSYEEARSILITNGLLPSTGTFGKDLKTFFMIQLEQGLLSFQNNVY